MSEICRAITFINYHIPYREPGNTSFQYTTLGFFDGMETKEIIVDYEKKGLYALWQYILDKTAQSNGLYSYQNVFCFGNDEWNGYQDKEFWDGETDRKYPLTFVSLLQLSDYSAGQEKIREKCIQFREVIAKELGDEGRAYVYSTIDKNDYVICIKCVKYEKAVKLIQEIHHKQKVIYSYTVFSVLSKVLKELNPIAYKGLYQQILPSICLKGVANSYDPAGGVTLDQRYHNFCMQLVSKLYGIPQEELSVRPLRPVEYSELELEADGKKKEFEVDYKIYDILGDDDFRLIVRNVNLGRLMKQFAEDEILSYKGHLFRFSLFSSSLILNTNTVEKTNIGDAYRWKTLEKMQEEFRALKCEQLEESLEKIRSVIRSREKFKNEKIITCCHAIWQLIQSMKALEAAPTKKYDFLSLYYPLRGLVQILEQKMTPVGDEQSGPSAEKGERASLKYDKQLELLAENEEIFEFIHKISMTIHGTLRTDIQFFQIRDFNAIVHYAPAKLRAFYTLWTMKIKDYYNMFMGNAKSNEYSFIFSPGMFSGTSVCQLFEKYDETHRLMLITVPERHLYVPKWLTIMLAHETSHFVGRRVRNREYRQEVWLKCCAKAVSLEMRKYIDKNCLSEYQEYVRAYFRQENPFETVVTACLKKECEVQMDGEPLWPHQFHSENSFRTIQKAFCEVEQIYVEKACAEECERISCRIRDGLDLKRKRFEESAKEMKKLRAFIDGLNRNMYRFFWLFTEHILDDLMRYCHYISAEAYADLNAVLTLNLKPKDYLASFFSCELERSYLEACNPNFSMLLPYRIALCIKAVIDVVNEEKYKEWCSGQQREFYQAWSGEVFDCLAQEFVEESSESKLVKKCQAVLLGLRDYGARIEEYYAVYQVKEKEVSWKDISLFLDQEIWDALLSYLKRCAKDYLDNIMESPCLQQEKNRLAKTYSTIAGASANQMMQEIESFLAWVSSDQAGDI